MRNIVDVEKTIEFILSHQANAEVQMEKIRESLAAHAAALAAHAAALAAQAEAQAAALAAQTANASAHVAALTAHAGAHAAALTAHAGAHAAALAAQAEVQAKGYAQHERVMARIDARLDRAIRLAVQDARAQRKRNQEFDEKITQLAAAQLVNEEQTEVTKKMMQVTEEKLQRFIDSVQRGANGHN